MNQDFSEFQFVEFAQELNYCSEDEAYHLFVGSSSYPRPDGSGPLQYSPRGSSLTWRGGHRSPRNNLQYQSWLVAHVTLICG